MVGSCFLTLVLRGAIDWNEVGFGGLLQNIVKLYSAHGYNVFIDWYLLSFLSDHIILSY